MLHARAECANPFIPLEKDWIGDYKKFQTPSQLIKSMFGSKKSMSIIGLENVSRFRQF